VNILTTEPEVKDSAYLPLVLEKVSTIKKSKKMKNLMCEVDGGFTPDNINDAIAVGADIVVSGRGVFLNGEIEKNIRLLKSAG
jgi:ribulose-phosphate 3-epimerase